MAQQCYVLAKTPRSGDPSPIVGLGSFVSGAFPTPPSAVPHTASAYRQRNDDDARDGILRPGRVGPMTSPAPRVPAGIGSGRPAAYSLRATSSIVTFWTGTAFIALLLGDAAIRQDGTLFLRWLLPGVLVAWALWMILWRPAIRVERARVVVVNLGRVVEIPWSRVTAITQRLQVVFDLDDGSAITAWGGPFPRRRGVWKREADASDRVDTVRLLEDARSSAPASSDPVHARIDIRALTIGLGLVAAVVLQVAASGGTP